MDPSTANIGVHVTRSVIISPPVSQTGPNDSSVTVYVHTTSKTIIILFICEGNFLYLLSCSIVTSDGNIYLPTVNTYVIIIGGTNNSCISRYGHIISKLIRTCSNSGNELGFLLPYPIYPMGYVGHTTSITIFITFIIPNKISITR